VAAGARDFKAASLASAVVAAGRTSTRADDVREG